MTDSNCRPTRCKRAALPLRQSRKCFPLLVVTFHPLHNTGRFSYCQRSSLPKSKVLWVMVSLLIVRTHTIRLWVGTLDSRHVHCCRGVGQIMVEDERIELSTLRCKRSVFPLALIPQNGWRGRDRTYDRVINSHLIYRWSTRQKINWYPDTDSNRNQEFWRLVCYHYTIEISWWV